MGLTVPIVLIIIFGHYNFVNYKTLNEEKTLSNNLHRIEELLVITFMGRKNS